MLKQQHIGAAERTKIVSLLFTGGESFASLFGDSELNALLQHQMNSSVSGELRGEIGESEVVLAKIEETLHKQGITTFMELFEHTSPPERVLRQVMRYAKKLLEKGPEAFPYEIAQVVYTLSGLCVINARQYAVSKSEVLSFVNLGRWCLAQTWLDDRTRNLVRRLLVL